MMVFWGGNMELITLVFTLFSNAVTMVLTYFFTRKALDSEHKQEGAK
jgi:hypothetical protein